MGAHWPEPSVFLAWDLQVKQLEAVQDAFRVVTPRGQFCLKRTSGPPERLEAIAQALDHVVRHDFHQVTPLLPTRDGRPCHRQGEACYYVTEWLPGTRPALRRPEMAVKAARCLAGFHQAAEGYSSSNWLRTHLGTWPARYAQRAAELAALAADRAVEFRPDEFTRAFLATSARWAALASWSLDLLAAAGYPEEVAAFRAKGGLCHGDPAERNFIFWESEPFLIDFDTLLVDLPVLDLARLVRRVDQEVAWDVDLAARMLAAYESARPLNQRERALLLALLAFPEKYWRAVHRYYREREGKSRRHLSGRLAEVEANWGSLNAFLPALAERLEVPVRPLPQGN